MKTFRDLLVDHQIVEASTNDGFIWVTGDKEGNPPPQNVQDMIVAAKAMTDVTYHHNVDVVDGRAIAFTAKVDGKPVKWIVAGLDDEFRKARKGVATPLLRILKTIVKEW